MHNVFQRINSIQPKKPINKSQDKIQSTQIPQTTTPEKKQDSPRITDEIQEKKDLLMNLIRRRPSKDTAFNPEVQIIAPTGIEDALEIADNLEQITARMTNLKRRMTPEKIHLDAEDGTQKKAAFTQPIQPIQPIQKLQRKPSATRISRRGISQAQIKLPPDLGLPR